MSQAGTINHDTAARLIGLAPGELEALVKAGAVRRADRNAYHLTVLVQDYIGHLKTERDRAELSPKQLELAEHMDMSERTLREFLDTAGIDHKLATRTEIRIAYIRRLREMAAGRFADGDLDLAKERSLLARAQRERIEMENAEKRNQLIPADEVEPIMGEAVVYARERLLESVSRLARDMPDGDPIAREEMLQAEFEAFLARLADWAHADEYYDEGEV